jgi:hypothetical protein
MPQRVEDPVHPVAIALLDQVVERVQPFPGFDGLEVGVILGSDVSHIQIILVPGGPG